VLKETVARRYSEALYALAKEAGAVDRTVRELDTFVAVLNSDAQLWDFYASPVVDRAVKTEVLRNTLASASSELTCNFLVLLARKRREALIATIARQMHELVDKNEGRAVAHVTTPMKLAPAELVELTSRLSRVYRQSIVADPRVDPDLLGGAVVQVGDRYVDGSVAGRLEEVKRHLLESAEHADVGSPNGKSPNGKVEND